MTATDPVLSWTIVKNVADATKKLYDIAKGLKDYETKKKLDEVLDELRDLKQQASQLEDENRNLKERLRFKSDDFEFKNPFWYEKAHPDQPLCPKCFANEKTGQMGAPYQATGIWLRCLVCENTVQIEPARSQDNQVRLSRGPHGWMR